MYEMMAISPEAFEIADRLTLLMEEHEPPVTRSELANAIGCAKSTISRYCDGTGSVAFIFAIRIARFFNVSLDYLVGLTDNKEIPQWEKPGEHKHSEHWHLKSICKRCYYRREMVGLAGLCGFDLEYDNKACHYPLDTGKFREIEATDMECPYFRPKRRERKVVPPAWDKMKSDENI